MENVNSVRVVAQRPFELSVGRRGRQPRRDETQPGDAAVDVVVDGQNGLAEAEEENARRRLWSNPRHAPEPAPRLIRRHVAEKV